jgi:iron complex transport system ATP-binding protein
MGVPVLVARGLAAGYRGRKVLEGVDLELRSGEVLALIGPNGAGKTTLFKTLSGELPPLAGEILVGRRGEGERMPSVSALSRRERASLIARVLQDEDPAWDLPVEDYVDAGTFAAGGWFGSSGGAERAAVHEALEAMDLLGLAKRPVTELSGGEFRRVLIARALAQRSRILLLDEPASDLDLARQMEVLGRLRALASEGKAVALSVHDLNLAAMVADRVALVAGGRIAVVGKPREVITAKHIAEAYGAEVIVADHPLGDFPQVIHAPAWLDGKGAERRPKAL